MLARANQEKIRETVLYWSGVSNGAPLFANMNQTHKCLQMEEEHSNTLHSEFGEEHIVRVLIPDGTMTGFVESREIPKSVLQDSFLG